MAKNRVRTCSSKNCKEKYFAKGFCRRHYRQTPEEFAIALDDNSKLELLDETITTLEDIRKNIKNLKAEKGIIA